MRNDADWPGLPENAGHEIVGPILAVFARHEIAGRENDGPNM